MRHKTRRTGSGDHLRPQIDSHRRSKSADPARYRCEPLEARKLLAANLHMVDAALSDDSGSTFSSVAAGQRYVYMRIDFQTTDLPANAQYMVQASVNGSIYYGIFNKGAGLAGTHSYNVVMGPWTKVAGSEPCQAVLDVSNLVSESNESDNARSFNVSGVVPPFKFGQPLEGTKFVDWNISNYVDLDVTDGVRDYRGGTFSYDGHNGWDIHMANFRQSDAGWDVYAGADGTVIAAEDGHFDRQVEKGQGDANYVTIDHGGGWTSNYYHLRRDSVQVTVGQHVVKGQLLGLVGSSGNSTGPHLHFAVYYNGNLVEPNIASSSYFTSPIGYSGDFPTVFNALVTNHTPSGDEQKNGPIYASTFRQGETVTYALALGGLEFADTIEFVWYRPDHTVAFNPSGLSGQIQGSTWNTNYILPGNAMFGVWEVACLINGVEKSRNSFTVGDIGAPQVEVFQGSSYVVDNRWTPFDFGSLDQGQVGAESKITFTVKNVGQATLNTAGLTYPAGFLVDEPLAATIPAGGSDDFTLALDPYAASTGHKIGTVSFTTNDTGPGESVFNFRVEGTLKKLTGIDLSDDPDTIYIRRNVDNTEIFINQPPGPTPDYSIPFVALGHLDFFTFGGNDTLTVDFTTGTPLASAGINYFAYPGTDTLIIYGDSRGESAVLTHSALTWAGIPILIDDVEHVKLYGNGGGESFTIGNGGLDALPPAVTVVGGGGTDSVLYDDSSQAITVGYTVMEENFFAAQFTSYYAELESLSVQAGSGDDAFYVVGTVPTTAVSLFGNAGNDVFHVTPFDSHLEYVKSPLTINGGIGQDSLTLHDQDHVNGEVFDITTNTIASSRTGYVPNLFLAGYSGLEQVIVNGGTGGDVFNIQSTGVFTDFFINAGAGNDGFFLAPTSKDLSDIDGELTLYGEEDSDTLIISDDNHPGPATTFAQFTNNSFDTSHSFPVHFGTIESAVFNGSDAGTATTVVSLPGNLALTLNGGAAEDIFVIGEQLTGLALLGTSGNIEVNGAAGNDTLVFNDQPSIENSSYTLSNAYFLCSEMAGWVHYQDIQTLSLDAGDGHNIIAVTSLASPLTIDSHGGDDLIVLGSLGGLLDPIVAAVTVNGDQGNDTLLLNDAAQGVAQTHTISSTTYTRTALPVVSYGTIEFLRLFSGTAADVININSTAAGTPVFISAGAGTDGIRVNNTSPTAPVTINPSPGDDIVGINTEGGSDAAAVFSGTQRLGTLTIASGGSAHLLSGGDKVLTTVSLSITGTGRLDLADNDMIWDYSGATPFATAQSLLTSGYAGGAWNGAGIYTSMGNSTSLALGFAEASDVAPGGKFSGEAVDGDAILIKFTYYGDANLDGMTDLNDLWCFSGGFMHSGAWAQGNFNYSGGVIDAADLGLLGANWQAGVGSPLAPVPTSDPLVQVTAPRRSARRLLTE